MRQIATFAVRSEGWCFDKRHKVETRAYEQERSDQLANLQAGFWYLPTRPSTVRRLMAELPLEDYSAYIFVDFGSGKARVLLIAAEYGFRAVVGVELRRELHEQAILNVQTWRGASARNIQCLNMDARDYVFPDENLVLYFFNPFGDEIMQQVLSGLRSSLDRRSRDIVLVMVYPEHLAAVEAMPHLQLYKELRHCRIYRSYSQSFV